MTGSSEKLHYLHFRGFLSKDKLFVLDELLKIIRELELQGGGEPVPERVLENATPLWRKYKKVLLERGDVMETRAGFYRVV